VNDKFGHIKDFNSVLLVNGFGSWDLREIGGRRLEVGGWRKLKDETGQPIMFSFGEKI